MRSNVSRREFLRLAGLGSAGLVLAACAGQAPEPEPTAAPSYGGATPTTLEKVVTATAAPILATTINVWDYDPTGVDLWVQADKNFQVYFEAKHPEIKVSRTVAPWTGFTEKFLTSVAGGAKYDVIYGWVRWLPQFLENDVVRPLDDIVAQDAEVKPDDFYDYGKEVVDGKLYGLGWYIGADFIYYNKPRVAEAGLSDPWEADQAGEWTYDALYEFAQKLTSEKEGARTYGFDMGHTRYPGDYSAMVEAWGGGLWDENFTKSTINSPENVELWKYIQKFYQEKLTPLPSEGGGMHETVGFANERVMGFVSGPNYVRLAVQAKAPEKFDIGMTRFPKGLKGQPHVAYLNSYYLGKSGEHPDAGWVWYKERSFSEAAATIYLPVGTSRFSVRKSIAPMTEYPWENVEVYDALREVMHGYRVSPKESEFETLYTAAWDELVLGQRPVEEILDQLAAEATQLLG